MWKKLLRKRKKLKAKAKRKKRMTKRKKRRRRDEEEKKKTEGSVEEGKKPSEGFTRAEKDAENPGDGFYPEEDTLWNVCSTKEIRPSEMGNASLENEYVKVREALYRPVAQLPTGYGGTVERLRTRSRATSVSLMKACR